LSGSARRTGSSAASTSRPRSSGQDVKGAQETCQGRETLACLACLARAAPVVAASSPP
jgi:hypothetical protein